MGNVISLHQPKPSTHLECKKCGATAEAKCDCGVEYVCVRAGEIAEKAVLENPEKSDRAIAKDIGVSHTTVIRARKKSTGTNVPVERRTGKDGKKRKMPANGGNKIAIPDGFVSITDAIRAGIELEKTGVTREAIVKKIGLGLISYLTGKDVVLLSERTDLAARDAANVKKALLELDEKRQVFSARQLVKPIVNKVWGKKGHRFKTDKRRLEDFQSSISYVLSTCEAAAEIEIPYLSDDQRASAIKELRDAKQALRILEQRIRKGYGGTS